MLLKHGILDYRSILADGWPAELAQGHLPENVTENAMSV